MTLRSNASSGFDRAAIESCRPAAAKWRAAVRLAAVMVLVFTTSAIAASPPDVAELAVPEHPFGTAPVDASEAPLVAPADDGAGAVSADGQAPVDAIDKYRTRSKLSVYFARRSVDLTDDALATIAENAERLKAKPAVSVTLVGYTDEVGSSSYGIAFAQRRVAVVAEALIRMGVDPRQIRSSAYGEEGGDTLPCATEICRISYRRVEFKYLKPSAADYQAALRAENAGNRRESSERPTSGTPLANNRN
ncbi:MAG: OmpA family protein [Rhodocyclaceae bacterium]|nr:OmpA family protein [Rhodocyclaceae bacterium]